MHEVSDISVNCPWIRLDSEYFPSPSHASESVTSPSPLKIVLETRLESEYQNSRVWKAPTAWQGGAHAILCIFSW